VENDTNVKTFVNWKLKFFVKSENELLEVVGNLNISEDIWV
jgi:hypothetical protein